MARRSAISQLPDSVRDELNRKLVANGFGDYEALAEWLREQGFDIGKSAVHRHGSALEAEFDEAMAEVRTTQALARAVQSDGNEGALLGATSNILQDQLLRVSIAIRKAGTEPAEAARLISVVARAHADVGRMEISRQKWQAEVRDKTRAAADAVTQVAKKGGLTAEAVETIRREILGIAS